jgi:DNA mismatch repair protein MSH6
LINSKNPIYGICFVDTATAEFSMSYLNDDEDRTLFQTLIMQIRPKEAVYEKGGLSQEALRILKDHIKHLVLNPIQPGREFPDAEGAMDEICINGYFSDHKGQSKPCSHIQH